MSVDFDVVDALAGFAEDLHSEGNFAMRLHDAVKRLKEERDEARAEVERLRMALGHADNAMRVVNDSIRAAYQRGAEAMREAAARMFEREAVAWGERLGGIIPAAHAYAIRDLPIPEDKP